MKKKVTEAEQVLEESELTERNKVFCREYIYDWNARRSYLIAYPGVDNIDSADAAASRLLSNVKVKAYIGLIQKDLEKMAGISRLKVLNEHIKLAYSSIAHLHNTWIERKEFENLTEDQKACISEIDTKIQRKVQWEYDEESEKKKPVTYDIEYIRIKLYDKQKALDSISKMMGYDAPQKLDLSNNGDKFEPIDYSKLDDSILRAIIKASKPDKG